MTTRPRNQMTGAEAMVRMLEAQGVQHIFGLCGDTSLPFYDAMRGLDHGITHILTRDERAAAYMADGYARVSGRVGVCEGPSGGGATYILPGLIEANESSSAILAITSDISVASYGKYPLTEVDQEALMRPLTQFTTVIRRADHIPRMVRAAFRAMTTGRPGAAHLGLPYDIQSDPVDGADIWADAATARFPARPVAPDRDDVAAAVAAICSARRPLIVCGGGVVIAGAMDALDRLARRLDIAVATSVSGKGSLADDHPLCLGVVGSNGGVDATWALVRDADLVVFMGCRAGSTTTARWDAPKPGTRIVHMDCDARVIGANYPTEVAVVGDLRQALIQVHQVLDGMAQDGLPQGGGAARVAKAKAEKFAHFRQMAESTDSPLRPERIIDALNRHLPADAVVVSDPGTSCAYFNAYSQQNIPGRHYITNRAHGALGYAIGAAIGAAFGRPDARVVALMGDGSFGFACGDLETAARLRVPVVFVVFSNAGYGWIKASQHDDREGRYYNVDFNRTDNAMVAEGFGVKAWRVETPEELDPALAAAFAHDGPGVIDVATWPLEQSGAPVMRWMG